MNFQTTKGQFTEIRHKLAISMLDHKTPVLIENLTGLLQRIFVFSNNKEKNNPDNKTSSTKFVGESAKKQKNEIRSLQHLENCANAARQTEACGQYEWVNKSDEQK